MGIHNSGLSRAVMIEKVLLLPLAWLLTCMIATASYAGEAGPAVPTVLGGSMTGQYYVTVTPHVNVPTCGQVTAGRFVIDERTSQGRAMIATVMMAYATGTTIKVYGTGLCDIDPASESVGLLHTLP